MIVSLEKMLDRVTRDIVKKEADEMRVSMCAEHYEKKVLPKYGYQDKGANHKIARYFARYWLDKEGKYKRFGKGLFLCGTVGTGKSFALRILSGLFELEFVHADEISRIYAKGGDDGLWEWLGEFNRKDLIIDDIGAERDLAHYGNKGAMMALIEHRYQKFLYNQARTHFSSNLDKDEIENQYDERTRSRLDEMCVFIPLTGKDMRTKKEAR